MKGRLQTFYGASGHVWSGCSWGASEIFRQFQPGLLDHSRTADHVSVPPRSTSDHRPGEREVLMSRVSPPLPLSLPLPICSFSHNMLYTHIIIRHICSFSGAQIAKYNHGLLTDYNTISEDVYRPYSKHCRDACGGGWFWDPPTLHIQYIHVYMYKNVCTDIVVEHV